MNTPIETAPIKLLRKKVVELGSQTAVAAWLGVSNSYVSDMLLGYRAVGEPVLAKLGIAKSVTYRTIKESE